MTGWAMTAAAPVQEGRTIWWAPQFEYDHKQMEVQLSGKDGRQAWIEQGGARIQAERIFWNRRTRVGRCYERVMILDLTNDTVITGGEAWHYSDDSRSVVRINPKMHMKKDDITVFADEMTRLGKDAQAEARGHVRIVTKDGTAWGDKAVYYQKRGELVLSGEPWLEQKTNIHRANEIIFFRNDDKVLLKGQAKLMQGRDCVRAGYIEIIDLDGTNSRATNNRAARQVASSGQSTTEKSTNRKNRYAFFRDDVRIFRYTKKNELESVTVGEEGEFFERRGYIRLIGEPRMVMVSDNTVTSGAVMEQYRDEDLALIKGNAFIRRGYRTVNAQLIRYDTKTRMAELAGNPVITEYSDSYRADFVTYDTGKDIISWRGSTMAVVGTAAQAKKESDWASQNNAAVYSLAGNANGANVIKVVGEVWLSTSGRAVTNKGQVSWGKRADDADAIPGGTHIVINDTWSWIDMLGRDGLMLRLRGPAHLVLRSAGWNTPPRSTNERSPGRTNTDTRASSVASGKTAGSSSSRASSPVLHDERSSAAQSASVAQSASSTALVLTNMKIAAEITNPVAGRTGKDSAPLMHAGTNQEMGGATNRLVRTNQQVVRTSRRTGRSLWDLRRGIILARPGAGAVLDLVSGVFSCSNLAVPLVAESGTNGGFRVIVLSNQQEVRGRIAIPAMRLVTFRSNSEILDFRKKNDSVLSVVIAPERPLVVRSGNILDLSAIMETRLSNELFAKNLVLSNANFSNTNARGGMEPDESILSNRTLIMLPGVEVVRTFYEGLTNVAATNTPGQPVVFAPFSRVNVTAPLQARILWEGATATWISETLAGQEFWKTEQLPGKYTEYGELIEEARGLSISWGRRPTTGPQPDRKQGGTR